MKISYENITFVNNLFLSMNEFTYIESNVTQKVNKKNRCFIKKIFVFIMSIFDLIHFLVLKKKYIVENYSFYLIHSRYVKKNNGEYEEIFYNNLIESKYIFFSYDKYNYFKKINNGKVYNFGIFVRLLKILKLTRNITFNNDFNLWINISNLITRNFKGNNIYIPSYSIGASLSLIFSCNRKNFNINEIQHGGVINYPPYNFISDFLIVNKFYYKNENSKIYLLNNLFNRFKPEFIKLDIENAYNTSSISDNIELFYISSYEYDNFHPVFLNFLKNNSLLKFNLRIRLHPRQMNYKENFLKSLKKYNYQYLFDDNINWYDNIFQNSIVITPFSSVVEDAVSLGFKTIVIDEIGKKRYDFLINNINCFYSDNIYLTLKKLYNL